MNFNNKSIGIFFGEDLEKVDIYKRDIQNGQNINAGFNIADMRIARFLFEQVDCETEFYILNQKIGIPTEVAAVLVIKKGIDKLLEFVNSTSDDMFKELSAVKWNKKEIINGKSKNTKNYWNIKMNELTDDININYEKKIPNMIDYNNIPLTHRIRDIIPNFIGDKAKDLEGTGYNYWDVTKTGKTWNAQTDKRKIFGVHLGESSQIYFQWYFNDVPKGQRMAIDLEHGDMYFLSEKAVGFDGNKVNAPILRHAYGHEDFAEIEVDDEDEDVDIIADKTDKVDEMGGLKNFEKIKPKQTKQVKSIKPIEVIDVVEVVEEPETSQPKTKTKAKSKANTKSKAKHDIQLESFEPLDSDDKVAEVDIIQPVKTKTIRKPKQIKDKVDNIVQNVEQEVVKPKAKTIRKPKQSEEVKQPEEVKLEEVKQPEEDKLEEVVIKPKVKTIRKPKQEVIKESKMIIDNLVEPEKVKKPKSSKKTIL